MGKNKKMKIHLAHLESILPKEKINELKKEVTFYMMKNQNQLKLDLKPEHVIPERMQFTAYVTVMPKELKLRKQRASREEISRRIFSELKEFRL